MAGLAVQTGLENFQQKGEILMRQGLKNIMMPLICYLSYGKWRFRTAYDTIYQGQKKSSVLQNIFAQVFGDESPQDAAPFSFVTLSDLHRMAGLLQLSPGDWFADIACGRGGPGMWIARKTGAGVKGVDISAEAVAAATARISEFGLGTGAVFNLGSFYRTGLASTSCDGAVSVDALWVAPDRRRALLEVARILKPGARFVFTTWDGNIPFMPADHRKNLEKAGFGIEVYEQTPGWKERQLAVYAKVLESRELLIREMGKACAMPIIKEARSTPPVLEKSARILVSAKKR